MPGFGQKSNARNITENIFAVILSLLVVGGSFVTYVGYKINTNLKASQNYQSQESNEASVLGQQTDNLIKYNEQDTISKNQFEFTSPVVLENSVLTFDNQNRQLLEGKTTPNKYVELKINNHTDTVKSNPNGFFSFKIPPNIVQFSTARFTVFDSNLKIESSTEYTFLQKIYLSRIYFVDSKYNEIFSVGFVEDYKSELDNFQTMQNILCKYTLDSEVDEKNFDFSKDKNLIILPDDIKSLNRETNKYAAFRVETKLTQSDLNKCMFDFKINSKQIAWHTQTLEDIKKQRITNIGYQAPLSAPAP